MDCSRIWLSLDENDNDLTVFLAYFLAAIRTAFPEIGGNTLALLNAAEIPPLRIITANLINKLNFIDQAYVVVLDDYHLIQDKRVHDLLAMLLLHTPQTLHLVLASRVDPPIPLANLRARGKVVEIRAQDLRFNKQETAEFVEKLIDTPVDQATAAALEERSEGWVTGLRLAVLSRQHLLDDSLIPGGLNVDNRLVTDYLLASVFSQQPPDVQQWLVQTAILHRFCPQLCEAVCSPDSKKPGTGLNGQSFVDLTQRANLFVIPLDQDFRWFRFHHLFQHFLQAELGRQRTVAEIGTLHARASEWLEANGLFEEAFQHALNSGDRLAPALLIERNRLDPLNDDKWPTVGRWLAKLPDDTVQQRPKLLLARAWVHYFQFALGAIPPLLQTIESTIQGEPDETSLKAEVHFFWGSHWYWLGQSQQSLEQLGAALKYLPVAYHQGQAEAELYYALARFAMGQKEAVVEELRRTLQLEQLPYSIRSRLLGALIFIYILSGESSKALQASRQLEDAVAPTGNAYLKTWVSYVQAVVHFCCNNLEAAAEHFARAVENRYVLHTRAAVDSLAGLALTYQILGQADKANSVMSQLLEFALEQKDPSYASIARSIQARLWLMQGDLESAARWVETAEPAFDVGRMFIWLEVPRITRCRVLVARGNTTGLLEAVELLTGYLQESQTQYNVLRAIEISVMLAIAYKKLDQNDVALEILEGAVIQSRPGGLIQPFAEVGPELVDLLKQLSSQSVAPDYITQILAAFPETPVPDADVPEGHLPIPSLHTALLEQLTFREREVLALLAQELSNQEIASSLTISVHTMKRHTTSIYGKLSVKNRRQAVLKAESLGILTPR